MAKGQKCPNCGEQTFQKGERGGALACSSCGAQGWIGDAGPAPILGKGFKCHKCGAAKQKILSETKGVAVLYCFGCKSTVFGFGLTTTPDAEVTFETR